MKSMGRILQTHFGCGLVTPRANLELTSGMHSAVIAIFMT